MKIAIFSDSHAYGGLSSWNAFFDKRAIGLMNYLYFRKHRHDQNSLKTMVERLLHIKPDIVICTGDITTSGELSEFNTACEVLSPIVENPLIEMFYIPGNHDYYVYDKRCNEALEVAFSYLNQGKLKLKDLPLALQAKGIDFCFANVCKPSNLFLSSAVVSRKNKEYILSWANSEKNYPKILIDHYPLSEKHSIRRSRHMLYGAADIRKEVKNGKIDLSIAGHVHCPKANLNERGRGEIITGSITGNQCFVLLDYDEKENIFRYNRVKIEK